MNIDEIILKCSFYAYLCVIIFCKISFLTFQRTLQIMTVSDCSCNFLLYLFCFFRDMKFFRLKRVLYMGKNCEYKFQKLKATRTEIAVPVLTGMNQIELPFSFNSYHQFIVVSQNPCLSLSQSSSQTAICHLKKHNPTPSWACLKCDGDR